RSQSQREQALRAFSSGRAQALVATDVAARGIHVDGVGCVVHFDLPATAKDYLHRSGRTGRAGSDGVVISFVTPADRVPVKALQRAIGYAIPTATDARPLQEVQGATKTRPEARARSRGAARPPTASASPDKRARRRRAKQINQRRGRTSAVRKPNPAVDRKGRPHRPVRRPSRAA
ncbi:MAG: helicase-related protein, partial [Acidimicrobiales bacterium]